MLTLTTSGVWRLLLCFGVIMFTSAPQTSAQTLFAIRNGGHVAQISATQATYYANLAPTSLGWVMYAGGGPVDPVTQNAYLIKQQGNIVELTPGGTQTAIANLSSYASANWSYPMVRMTDGTLVAINIGGKLVKVVSGVPSLLADLSGIATDWQRIAIDHNNHIIAMSVDGYAVDIAPNGTQTLIANASGMSTSNWVKSILASDGRHYLLNTDGKVFRYDACGLSLLADLSQYNTQNSWINLANHPNGKMYSVNYYGGQVAEIDPSTGSTSVIVSFETIYPQFWYGPVIDNAGTIHVWQNFGYFKRVYPNGTVGSISPDMSAIASNGWYSIATEQYLVNPAAPPNCCQDSDGDGFEDIACGGTDCDDTDPTNFPGNPEICDGHDNNCDGVIDEGFDADADGVADCFDNCPSIPNPGQEDADGDGVGDACTGCPVDTDDDGVGDLCDNCVAIPNADQADSDGDNIGDVCDVCPATTDHSDNNNDGVPDCANCGNNGTKFLVCHVPPGNPCNEQQLCISPNASQAHLDGGSGHGNCYIGQCSEMFCPQSISVPEMLMGPVDARAGYELFPASLPVQPEYSGVVLNAGPSPFDDRLHISLKLVKPGPITISIYKLNGALQHSTRAFVSEDVHITDLTTRSWVEGMYFLEVLLPGQNRFTRKLVCVH